MYCLEATPCEICLACPSVTCIPFGFSLLGLKSCPCLCLNCDERRAFRCVSLSAAPGTATRPDCTLATVALRKHGDAARPRFQRCRLGLQAGPRAPAANAQVFARPSAAADPKCGSSIQQDRSSTRAGPTSEGKALNAECVSTSCRRHALRFMCRTVSYSNVVSCISSSFYAFEGVALVGSPPASRAIVPCT
eukprot:290016-Pleurochrysis_carterae.AAC.11